ncbi:MAG: hypothetical protein ACJ780_10620 [Solirubrobacteraceae bacterium]
MPRHPVDQTRPPAKIGEPDAPAGALKPASGTKLPEFAANDSATTPPAHGT